MNARQKAKKYKKELERIKNSIPRNKVVHTNMPVIKYRVDITWPYLGNPGFTDEGLEYKIKDILANAFKDTILENMIVYGPEKPDIHDTVYSAELYIGNPEGIFERRIFVSDE